VEQIDEDAWQPIDYPQEGEAQIAETTYGGRRLIVRRTLISYEQITPILQDHGLANLAHDVDARIASAT
jgi:hypothetical protein